MAYAQEAKPNLTGPWLAFAHITIIDIPLDEAIHMGKPKPRGRHIRLLQRNRTNRVFTNFLAYLLYIISSHGYGG